MKIPKSLSQKVIAHFLQDNGKNLTIVSVFAANIKS